MPKIRGFSAGSPLRAFFRFAAHRGLRSAEIDPEEFRRYLARRHTLHVTSFHRMQEIPLERLDAVSVHLIRDAERWALAEGVGFGLGGILTLVPDTSFLAIITLRLIQRLCLLYGFETHGLDARRELWLAAAAATGIDFGKELAEKQMVEKIAPRVAERLALKIGEEAAGKWIARTVPLASSAFGGGLNFFFVRAWGRKVQRNLRARHLTFRSAVVPPPSFRSAPVAAASQA